MIPGRKGARERGGPLHSRRTVAQQRHSFPFGHAAKYVAWLRKRDVERAQFEEIMMSGAFALAPGQLHALADLGRRTTLFKVIRTKDELDALEGERKASFRFHDEDPALVAELQRFPEPDIYHFVRSVGRELVARTLFGAYENRPWPNRCPECGNDELEATTEPKMMIPMRGRMLGEPQRWYCVCGCNSDIWRASQGGAG